MFNFITFSFQFKKKSIKKKKKTVPDPVSNIHVIAMSDSATLSWETPSRATNYHVYLVIAELLTPINDGAGLDVTTNEVTIYSVYSFLFFLLTFFYLIIKMS